MVWFLLSARHFSSCLSKHWDAHDDQDDQDCRQDAASASLDKYA